MIDGAINIKINRRQHTKGTAKPTFAALMISYSFLLESFFSVSVF